MDESVGTLIRIERGSGLINRCVCEIWHWIRFRLQNTGFIDHYPWFS